jgi:small acid-soluble spore protein (thioredoxin-like protein)
MEAAEDAMNFAEGKELKSIKEKNARRKVSIEALEDELEAENKSRINGYF